MKKLNTISLCFVAVAACVLGGMLRPASAQTALPQKQQFQIVLLHNVRPDIMAYWIDPARQTVPPEYQNHQTYPSPFSENINQYIPQIKAFQNSFHGHVIAIDAQNALGIVSSQENFDSDKKLIEAMDKPIQQVDIDARFLSIDPQILKTLLPKSLIWQKATDNNHSYKMAIVAEDVDSLVQRLRATGKVRELNSPRVSTIDNLPANLWSMTTTSVNVELKANYPGQILPVESIGGQQIGLAVSNIVRMIPTINADGSVKMSVTLLYEAMLVHYQDEVRNISKEAGNQPILLDNKKHDGLLIKGLYNTPVTFDSTINENQSILITGNDGKDRKIIMLSIHVQP